jgi:RND family efflux transporter MFP subunit
MKLQSIFLLISITAAMDTLKAQSIEAFTEPYRLIAVSASEIGIIERLTVIEGQRVQAKQVIGKLDDSVLSASLEVARSAAGASGARMSAEADFQLRKQQLNAYQLLERSGNATHREIGQAELEVEQAAARLQGIREDIEVRQLECERIRKQIEQRQIVSPIDGIITSIEKNVGEFVSPTDPVVLHVVKIDTLLAIFSVPRVFAGTIKPGTPVMLSIGVDEGQVKGEVEYVAPIANPESNTVRVKIRVANSDGKCPSGVVCRWELNSGAKAAAPVIRSTKITNSSTPRR